MDYERLMRMARHAANELQPSHPNLALNLSRGAAGAESAGTAVYMPRLNCSAAARRRESNFDGDDFFHGFVNM
jgi:hypothetical protein